MLIERQSTISHLAVLAGRARAATRTGRALQSFAHSQLRKGDSSIRAHLEVDVLVGQRVLVRIRWLVRPRSRIVIYSRTKRVSGHAAEGLQHALSAQTQTVRAWLAAELAGQTADMRAVSASMIDAKRLNAPAHSVKPGTGVMLMALQARHCVAPDCSP